MPTRTTVKALTCARRITIATFKGAPPSPDFPGSTPYHVVLTHPHGYVAPRAHGGASYTNPTAEAKREEATAAAVVRTMATPFYMGSACKNAPEAWEVLGCLCADAAGYDNARNFDDWCSEYDNNPDSRKALALYERIGRDAAALKVFLGDDYAAFLEAEY